MHKEVQLWEMQKLHLIHLRVKISLLLFLSTVVFASERHINIDDAFYENSVKNAPNAKPVLVRDIDSAME